MPSYVPSSVYHVLPERERRVKFNFDAGENHGVQRDAIENENGEEADLRLAIRLQKEENAAALEVRRQKQAETAVSTRRRSGRSCAHGFGLSTTPLSTGNAEVIINDESKTKDSTSPHLSPMNSPMASPMNLPSRGHAFRDSDMDLDATTTLSDDAASASHIRLSSSSSLPGASIEGHIQTAGVSRSITRRGSATSAQIANEEKDDTNSPAWLKIRRVENSAKNTAQAAQKMLEEEHSKESSARRRSGMGMFAPKWR